MHVELLCNAFHLHCGFFFLFGVTGVLVLWLCLGVPPEREVCEVMWILLWFSVRLLEAAVMHRCHNQCATLHFSFTLSVPAPINPAEARL